MITSSPPPSLSVPGGGPGGSSHPRTRGGDDATAEKGLYVSYAPIYSPPHPQAYHPRSWPITRLFSEFRYIEQQYFLKTGAFPPQHLIVLRREAWEANPWVAESLTEAFIAANECFTAAQKGFPYATPWLEAELEDTVALMGEDFHPYGFERNRTQIEMFAAEAFRLGLTRRLITPDEYFADYLQRG